MDDWYAENVKWVDAFIKTAAAESPQNKQLLSKWALAAVARTLEALGPLAELMHAENAQSALDQAEIQLRDRLVRVGLSV